MYINGFFGQKDPLNINPPENYSGKLTPDKHTFYELPICIHEIKRK